MKLFGKPLRKYLTIMPFENPKRSAFAESAYAHAKNRMGYQESNDLFYYDDETADDPRADSASAVHAELQPLAGECE